MIKICSTDFMEQSLKWFSKDIVRDWYTEAKKIDDILKHKIKKSIPIFSKNNNLITPDLKADFLKTLLDTGIKSDYEFSNMEAYYGYTVYAFPDRGEINAKSGNPDLYYGIAKTDSFGIAHTHKLSDAFNYILSGEGVFTGITEDQGKFKNYYHGKSMVEDSAFEIPKGMTHGHLVKEGSGPDPKFLTPILYNLSI